MVKVSIVILTWNSLGYIKKFLPILIAKTASTLANIVIVDNGSSDGTGDWIANKYPQLHLIALDRNYGYSGGYAIAMDKIPTPFAILLNSDIEVSDGWLEGMIRFMEDHPACGALAPKILSFDNRTEFEYAGAAGGWIDRYGFPFCRGRIFNSIEKDTGQYSVPEKVFWASGACLMLRLDAYRQSGGLDPNFFAHMEEIDLCWRLQATGHEIWYYPDSSVYHVGGGTLPNESPFKLYLNFRNNLVMLYKNLPGRLRGRILFTRMIFDGVAAIQYLLKGKITCFQAVLKAHRSFKKLRKSEYLSYVGPVMTEPFSLPGYYNGSIVIGFFMRGIRNFRNLRIQR